MSDLHDIRYLHDKNIPDDTAGSDYAPERIISAKKVAIVGGILSFLILGSTLFIRATLQHTQQSSQTILSQESSSQAQTPSPIPTITTTKIEGTIICIDQSSQEENQTDCNRGIKTKTGETFALQNVQYADISSGMLTVGKAVEVTGTTQTISNQSGGQSQSQNQNQPTTIFVSTVENPPPGTIPTETPIPPTPTDVPAELD
jgi:hypothetical protein